MKLKLQDRTAVITGASKGLGRAMALALAAEGARIALVSRDREKLTRWPVKSPPPAARRPSSRPT